VSGEKTEKPTPKKLKQAREEGNIPQSRDVAAWLSTAAGAVMIPRTIEAGRAVCRQSFSELAAVAAHPEPARALAVLTSTFSAVPGVVGPLAVVTVLAVIVSGAMQGTLAPATKKLKPKFSNLNPVNGFKQHWGPAGVWEGVKSLPMSTIVGVTKGAVVSMITVTVLVGLVIAAVDYGMSRRRIMGKLKMSVQDIKQEHKNAEGDPLLKGAIRSKQMAMSRNRMMSDVASADVVVVNPTHIAVALRYEPGSGAPRVVATGAGAIATRIRERARENDVPLVKDVALARSMYKSVKVGQEVPADLYAAVAKVLAFVMSLRERGVATPLGDAHTVPA
jgi:flagellar biosynthetic protein FlhB